MIFDGDRSLLGQYMSYVASEVGLRDWTIALKDSPCDEQYAGTCSPIYGRKWAGIALSKDWMHVDEYDLRHTIVHEMLHCHTDAITQPLDDIEDVIGKLLHAPLMNAQRVAVEFAVDAIADALAPHLLTPSDWLDAETAP